MAVRWGSALAAAVLAVSILMVFWSARNAPSLSAMPPETTYRVVGAWQGRVAVFLPDADRPEHVYDTPLAVLPPEEQQRLTEGIPVLSAACLQECLEDYVG